MRKSMLLAAPALALCLSAPAMALDDDGTEEASVENLDPRTIAAAERLLEITEYQKLMDDTVEAMIAAQKPILRRQLESQPETADEEFVAKMLDFVDAEIRRMFDEEGEDMRQAFILLYAKYFTTEELERLIVINQDPVMKKSLKVTPALMAETMTLIQGVVKHREGAMKERLLEMITEYMSQSDS